MPPPDCLAAICRNLPALSLGMLLALAGCAGEVPRPEPAEIVLRGGGVMTMDASGRDAEAVAVAGGRIVYVGDDAGAQPWIGPGTEVVELAGRMALPGFQDAHVHPVVGGAELAECDLNAARDAAEVLAGIARCAAGDRESAWLRGGGFQLPHFPGGNPTAAQLDAIEPERPVFLSSADGHSAWVNSAALRLAGVTAATPDPPQGRIERDGKTGEPSGTLRETAIDLVARHLPPRTAEELDAGLGRALELAAGFGITALQEASAGRAELAAFAGRRDRGELTARVSVSLLVEPARGVEQIPELLALRDAFEGGLLRVSTVKLFIDGVIEGQTAALLEPYVGRGEDRGELNFEPEVLNELATALDGAGFQIHAHAIGDRAIRVTLDALEHAERSNGRRDARHHIAHAQLIDPADIPRFQALGVSVNFQPLWAWADTYVTDLTEPFLGPERSRWLYPMATVAASGARIALGSDWTVSSMNPLLGIEVGVTRSDPHGSAPAPWIPEERLPVETLLAAYTRGSAWVDFLDQETGSIEVGKAADLVVLDRDVRAIPPEEIGEARVLLTLFDGRPVYRRPDGS